MPRRVTPLVNGEYYHVYNRGSRKQPIFRGIKDYKRAFRVLEFYTYAEKKFKYSYFSSLSQEEQLEVLEKLRGSKKLVDVICYCFMPNHFHFLVKQNVENGISNFLRLFQNSYTRYFNTKYKEIGPLLQGQFKAVHIESTEQLLHISRYIHLNPYSSYLIKNIEELGMYHYSSYLTFILEDLPDPFNSKEVILGHFPKPGSYQNFVEDQATYQRSLEFIKHLTIE